jgi:hypothetical protein
MLYPLSYQRSEGDSVGRIGHRQGRETAMKSRLIIAVGPEVGGVDMWSAQVLALAGLKPEASQVAIGSISRGSSTG